MAQSNLGKVMLMPRGNYSAGETYNMLDFVLHGGASFVALENDLRGVTPSADSPSWQLLAAAAEEIYVESQTVEYAAQAAADYTGDPPESGWSSEVPPAQNGNYLWTRIITTYSDGTSFTAYLVAKNGVNGTGAVASVNGVNPDANGNVLLTIGNIATVDQTPTAGSNNLVTSGGVNQFVYGVLSGKENTSNKVTVWGATPSDEKYPSEKLVKDSLDAQSSQIVDLQTLLTAVLPAEYNTSATYAVGAVCMHNGLMYQATQATSGTWNSSHWTQVRINNVAVLGYTEV